MSSKGTSWFKQQAKYSKKINKRYYYPYEALYKKMWKQAKNKDSRYESTKAEYEKLRRSKANADIAKAYVSVAKKYEKAGNERTANEIRNKSNKYRRKSLEEFRKTKLSEIKQETLDKGKAILNKLLKGK